MMVKAAVSALSIIQKDQLREYQVNVNRAHPEPGLIRLALTKPEELIILTDLKIGHYLEISVLIHLEECEQCRKSAMEDVEFY